MTRSLTQTIAYAGGVEAVLVGHISRLDVQAVRALEGEGTCLLTCHQGLQLGAVREMRRVLAPGGRVAIATWRSLPDIPVVLELNAIADRHVGTIVDLRHSFGDANALKTLLTDGDLDEVGVDTVSRDVRFDEGALFVRLNATAVIGMSEKGKASTDAERGELAASIAESRDVISRCTEDGAFLVRLPAGARRRARRRVPARPSTAVPSPSVSWRRRP